MTPGGGRKHTEDDVVEKTSTKPHTLRSLTKKIVTYSVYGMMYLAHHNLISAFVVLGHKKSTVCVVCDLVFWLYNVYF